MEPLIARMDFDLPDVPVDFKQRVEGACNEAVRLNRQIDVRVLPREQAMAIPNIIRTASDLLPPDIEMVRIVDINGIDMQADGGLTIERRRGTRAATTFRKLPNASPGAKATTASAKSTSELSAEPVPELRDAQARR